MTVRKITIGDTFEVKPPGTFVTVTRYTDTTCIEVKDDNGHTRTVNAQSLLKGRLHWRYKDGTLKKDLFTYEDVRDKKPIKKVREKPLANDYYVYTCSSEGVVVYVGQGKGNRFLHCVSGVSNNKYLNRDFFAGKPLIAEVYKLGLTRDESLKLESSIIQQLQPSYNKKGK